MFQIIVYNQSINTSGEHLSRHVQLKFLFTRCPPFQFLSIDGFSQNRFVCVELFTIKPKQMQILQKFGQTSTLKLSFSNFTIAYVEKFINVDYHPK